jgi:hypothetical protein
MQGTFKRLEFASKINRKVDKSAKINERITGSAYTTVCLYVGNARTHGRSAPYMEQNDIPLII